MDRPNHPEIPKGPQDPAAREDGAGPPEAVRPAGCRVDRIGASKRAAERLKALTKLYGAELPGRLDELESMARRLSGAAPLDDSRQLMLEISDLAHKIAGTAGTFGFPEVTLGTRAIEERLRPVIAAGGPMTPEHAAVIVGLVEKLKKQRFEEPGTTTGGESVAHEILETAVSSDEGS